MSSNKAVRITKKIEISKLQLWLLWLLLFVLPSIMSIFGFNYYKQEYIDYCRMDLIGNAFENIRNYNELIAPEAFIEEQLKEVKKLNNNNSLESLKYEIDRILCGETLFCMFFDEKAEEIKNIKSKKCEGLSVNFLKIYISNLIKAYQADKKQNIEIVDAQKQLALSLQVLFKTVTPVTIVQNEVAKNFSVIHDGELYFVFAKFDKTLNNSKYFFAIMKGKDFLFRKMLEILHKRFPEIRIIFKDIDINKITRDELLIHSGIKNVKNEVFITCPTSIKFARHVLHDGSVFLNPGYGSLLPFIEYKIPTKDIYKSFTEIERILKISVLFIALLSAMYFLHISLFGFNPKLKFKTKIIILTLLSAIFPFVIFSSGIYSVEKYTRFINKILITHQAELELQLSAQELEHYLTDIETKLAEYAMKLSECLSKSLDSSKFIEQLSSIGDDVPLSKLLIYLDSFPKELKAIASGKFKNRIAKDYPERISLDLIEEQNADVINEIPSYILYFLNEKKVSDRTRKNYFELAYQKIDSEEIGNSLLNNGKLVPLNEFASKTWYQFQKLQDIKSDISKVFGVFLSKFEPRPILYFFFDHKKYSSLSKIGFKIKNQDYEINFAFFPVENSGTATIWNGNGHISNDDKKLCLKNPQSGILYFKNRTIIKKLNHNVPHMAVAIIKELIPYNDNEFIFKVILRIACYLTFILIFTGKLLDLIFIEPVMKLAKNANDIARGGDSWNTEINSGDEFELLNNDFKELVIGLKERNILKSYVSEDAFSDIEKSEGIKLQPGGEYMEATIVFAAIKGYEQLASKMSPHESIKLLSNYVSIVEETTKEFDGSLDKILGDTVMLVFRDNPKKSSHGLRGTKASLELVRKIKTIGLDGLYIGIASGRVISGKIGSYTGKLDFTVIGNPVNLAARFKTESKKGTSQTGIIISGRTIGLTKGMAKVKFLRRAEIKGKAHKYNIYELIGIRDYL